ncbi:MAG: hypothetical protein JWN03_6669 [Nocardia sp.]|nr:hypothetical protein [Nocardia sp.]
MPADTVQEPGEPMMRPASLRSPVRAACTATPKSAVAIRLSSGGAVDVHELLTAAQQRAAELEEQLAAAVARGDAAEQQAAQLKDRNREMAVDLDNALDQLAGHALHVEQERLFRTPAWNSWTASAEREGGGFER